MAHGHAIGRVCESLARRGAEVELWYPRQTDPDLAGEDLFRYYNVAPVFRLRVLGCVPGLPAAFRRRIDSMMKDPYAWGRWAAVLCRLRPADFYLTRSIELAFWLTRYGLPTVYELHQPSPPDRTGLFRAVSRSPALRGVVALTRFLAEYAISLGVPADRVAVQPSGVDVDRFHSAPSQAECRRQVGLPVGTPVVGYIGRFRMWDPIAEREVEKGLRMLISAFQRVGPVDGRRPRLVCVGGPAESIPEYVQLARQLGLGEDEYSFVDRVTPEQVVLWMRACDVVTLPWSDDEDFGTESLSPLKLFEYMAAHVAIVATDLPAFRERLRHDENAWLVERGDLDGFAGALRTLLTDHPLRERLAAQAFRHVQKYTWAERVDVMCRLAGY